jgi:hypothetical protein
MSSLSRASVNGWQPGARTATVEEFAEVFWERVDKSGDCWLWLGRVAGKGYGQITSKWFKTEIAHRIAYELEVGPIPVGMLVCHHCDNRLCMRPSHLFVGTDRDNVADMLRKGRSTRVGERNPAAKMTDAQVAEVKALYQSGLRIIDIARRLGYHPERVGSIVRGRTWRHVKAA